MRLLSGLRQQLGWRLFVSYLVVIGVDAVVLVGIAEIHVAAALSPHLARIQALLGGTPDLVANLNQTFTDAIGEVLLVATLVSILAAVVVSIFIARRILGPLQVMTRASRQIAAGDYHQRVQVAGEDELSALAQSFNSMAEALEQTELRRMELIGDVAHELRTPLASIGGTMEGLVDGVMPADPETYLGVQREVKRLQQLAGDLEELSRAEAGQIPLDLRPVNLAELLQRAAERLASQYQDKGVALGTGIPADLPRVRADAGRITQVLVNLLGNALQYTPEGGRVTVSAFSVGGMVSVRVEDTGIGIASQHLPHVFERFYRVDRSRARAGGGSGIGLTISRHLVEAHGGRISAASPGLGGGSVFTFTLPFAS